jgi:hypothetical protein
MEREENLIILDMDKYGANTNINNNGKRIKKRIR